MELVPPFLLRSSNVPSSFWSVFQCLSWQSICVVVTFSGTVLFPSVRLRGRPKKNSMEGIKKAMNERNLNEGQWEDRKQWSLGVGQGRKTF